MKLIFEVDVPGPKPTYPHDGPGANDAIKRTAEALCRAIECIRVLKSPDLYDMRAVYPHDVVNYNTIQFVARCIGVEL